MISENEEEQTSKSECRATLNSACALVALAVCATEPAARLSRSYAVMLPRFETARKRADQGEIVAWYEREAASADQHATEAYLAFARLHRRLAEVGVELGRSTMKGSRTLRRRLYHESN